MRRLWNSIYPAEAAVFLFVGVLFYPALFGGQTLWVWDASLNFLPAWMHQAERLASGDFPEWTSRILGGFPVAADPVQALFFPLKLIFLLPVDPGWLANAFVALVYLLTGFGMVRLARTLGMDEWASALTAVVYTGSGALASESFLTNWLVARTFVPWMLAEFVLIGKAESIRTEASRLVRALLFGSMALLAGEPQTFMLQYVLGFLVILFPAAENGPSLAVRLKRALIVTGVLSAWAFILATIQWLPALELAKESPRGAHGVTLEDAHHCTTHPVRYLELFYPLFYGTPSQPGTLWPNRLFCFETTKNFYIPSFYIGLPALVLAIMAVSGVRRDRRSVPWVVFGGVALVMTLGARGYLFDLVWNHAPYWKHFRWPERLVPWLTLALAVLAGLGGSRLFRSTSHRTTGIFLLVSGTVVFVLSLLTDWWFGFAGLWDPVHPEIMRQTVADSLEAGGRMGLVTAAIGAVLVAGFSRPLPELVITVPAALMVLMNASTLVTFVPGTETVRTVPVAAQMLEQLRPTSTIPHRVEVLPVYRGFRPPDGAPPQFTTTVMWHLLFANASLASPVDSSRGYNSFLTTRWLRVMESGAPPVNIARLFAADSIVAAAYDPSLPLYGEEGYPLPGGAFLVLLSGPVPRAFCPVAWKPAAPEEIMVAIRGEGFDPHQELLFERTQNQPEWPAGERPHPATRCEITRYGHEAVLMEIDQNHAGPVVLMDSYMPGWTAWVNGNESPVHVAWGLNRAVWVPAGRSVVEFTYRTPGLRTGATVSLLALLGTLVFLRKPFRQPRETAPSEG